MLLTVILILSSELNLFPKKLQKNAKNPSGALRIYFSDKNFLRPEKKLNFLVSFFFQINWLLMEEVSLGRFLNEGEMFIETMGIIFVM